MEDKSCKREPVPGIGEEELAELLKKDLKVFPIPGNTDSACRFPVFYDTWGEERTFGGNRTHEGCDLMGDWYAEGTYPVLSMTDGVVEHLGWLKLGGRRGGLRAQSGLYNNSADLHSYAPGLAEGDFVKAGQRLGLMGSTGYSTVPGTRGNFPAHLHVGMYRPLGDGRDKSFNPYPWLCALRDDCVVTESYPFKNL